MGPKDLHGTFTTNPDQTKGLPYEYHELLNTAQKVSLFGVFLVRVFPHSDQKKSEYGLFHAVEKAQKLLLAYKYYGLLFRTT